MADNTNYAALALRRLHEDRYITRKYGDELRWLGQALTRPAESAAPGPVDAKYQELLYAVACKYPGESRHETALRYIRERESREVAPSSETALAQPKPDAGGVK
jgi:hypothetical protein